MDLNKFFKKVKDSIKLKKRSNKKKESDSSSNYEYNKNKHLNYNGTSDYYDILDIRTDSYRPKKINNPRIPTFIAPPVISLDSDVNRLMNRQSLKDEDSISPKSTESINQYQQYIEDNNAYSFLLENENTPINSYSKSFECNNEIEHIRRGLERVKLNENYNTNKIYKINPLSDETLVDNKKIGNSQKGGHYSILSEQVRNKDQDLIQNNQLLMELYHIVNNQNKPCDKMPHTQMAPPLERLGSSVTINDAIEPPFKSAQLMEWKPSN